MGGSDWLKRYIGIMQKRYQDQFEVSMDIPEYLRSLEVPKLFLQPFVENAIVMDLKIIRIPGRSGFQQRKKKMIFFFM